MMDGGNKWTQRPSEQTSMQTHTHTHATVCQWTGSMWKSISQSRLHHNCYFSEQWIQSLLLFFSLQSLLTLIFILSRSLSFFFFFCLSKTYKPAFWDAWYCILVTILVLSSHVCKGSRQLCVFSFFSCYNFIHVCCKATKFCMQVIFYGSV